MTDNLIEIVNNDILVQIEDSAYELAINNLIVLDYSYAQNKPRINTVELIGNKTSADLGLVTHEDMQLKEDKINKTDILNSASTDIQYPTAKAVYDKLQEKADTDLANLSQAGQNIIDLKANTDLSNLSYAGQSILDLKADTDLSNITPAQSAKNTIINWGMPDYDNQISLSGSITQYTPPTDGYMHIYGYVTQNKHFMLGLSSPVTDAAAIAGFATTSNNGADYGGYYVPVAGNRTYYIDNDGIVLGFYFVPCKGAN